jgi:quercetin dioxygenase-like cupin family protein
MAVGLGLVVAQSAQGKGKEPVMMPAEDMKWTEVPNTGGVMVAPVKGDLTKGAYDAFTKFPAGVDHPLHTHSADIETVIISGTFLYGPEGGPVKKFGPGSYIMIPGGVKHTSGCDAASPCIIFQEQPAKFDIKMVETKAPPAKK